MVYVFDTNSMRVLGNYYPARFPTFWQLFDDAVATGLVVSVREVRNELEDQVTKDWYLNWIAGHREMFLIPGPDETDFVGEIFRVAHFHALVGETQRLRGQPVADPFSLLAQESEMEPSSLRKE